MVIEPRKSLKGVVAIPGDKTISHRALVLGALSDGVTVIERVMIDDDSVYIIDCLRQMQVRIEILHDNKVKVYGNGLNSLKPPTHAMNTGESSMAAALLIGVLSGQAFPSTIIRGQFAQKQLKATERLIRPLRKMESNISCKDDGSSCPIVIVPSKLKGATHVMGSVDEYAKTSILLASIYAEGETIIKEPFHSRNHTELMLNCFGANLKIVGNEIISSNIKKLTAQNVQIPSDIGLASYFITAAMIVPNSEIVIKDVGVNPTRAGILEVYKRMGANIIVTNDRMFANELTADITVTSSDLTGIVIDENLSAGIMDEIPIVAVAATMAKGKTVINGLSGCKLKENGILKLFVTELLKMGAKIQETEDSLIIEGTGHLKGTIAESYNNVQVAMALCVAALSADEETLIRKSEVIDTVFPELVTMINNL